MVWKQVLASVKLNDFGVGILTDSEPNPFVVVIEHHVIVLEEKQTQNPLVLEGCSVDRFVLERALPVFKFDVVLTGNQVLHTVKS